MANDLVKSHKITVGIECESLEDDSWGVARLTLKLLEQLAARPELIHTHRFVLFFNKRIPDLPVLKNPIFRCKIVGLPASGLPSSFSIYYYILLPLRLWFSGLDSMYYPNYMLPLLHPLWVPSMVMLTEDIWYEMRNPRRPLRYRLGYSIFSTWAARMATRIVAISDASAKNLHELFHISQKRITANTLAVDTPQSSVEPIEGSYILSVGQAFERRHLREIIGAFAELAKTDPELRLVAIGPDKYDPPIIDALVEQTNATLGRPAVQHISHVREYDLARFYKGSRLCVYVSDLEAFGLPPLEALSYGAIPVVADAPVNREIYGEHAVYATTPLTQQRIKEAIEHGLSDVALRESITSGASTIIKRYTWGAHATRFLAMIDAVTA